MRWTRPHPVYRLGRLVGMTQPGLIQIAIIAVAVLLVVVLALVVFVILRLSKRKDD